MGSLSRFSAIEVVSFIVEGGKSGVLSIESGGGYRIRFDSGRIAGAACDSPGPDSTAADLVVRAMLQEHGSFTLFDSRPWDEGKVDLDPLPLIERARQSILESETFDPSHVLTLARDLDAGEMFSAVEVRILREVDGRSILADLVERSGLPGDVVREVTGSLIRRGWLVAQEELKSVERQPEASAVPADDSGPSHTSEAGEEGENAPELESPSGTPAAGPQTWSGPMACITLDDTDSTSYPLFDEVLTIGRARQNDIQIEDKSVSSSHAQIIQTADGHVIEDLGSSNGTFVNGKRVEKSILRDNDRLRLGTVFMVYMIPSEVSVQSVEEESPS